MRVLRWNEIHICSWRHWARYDPKQSKKEATLNPGIPGAPEGPGGQMAGHCRGQRQNNEDSTLTVCWCNAALTAEGLQTYQKVAAEIMKCTRKTLAEVEMTTEDTLRDLLSILMFICKFTDIQQEIHWVAVEIYTMWLLCKAYNDKCTHWWSIRARRSWKSWKSLSTLRKG